MCVLCLGFSADRNYITLIVLFHSVNAEAIYVKPRSSAAAVSSASSKHTPPASNNIASDNVTSKPRSNTIPKKQTTLFSTKPMVKSSVTAAELTSIDGDGDINDEYGGNQEIKDVESDIRMLFDV